MNEEKRYEIGDVVYLKSDKELTTPMTVSCVHRDCGYLGTVYVPYVEVVYIGGDGIAHSTILVTKALITLVQDLEKEVEECTHVQPISRITRGSYVMIWGSQWRVDWVDGAYLGVSNYKNEHHEQVHKNTVTLIEPTSIINDILDRV